MKYPILTFILLTLFSINQLTLSAQLYDNTWMMGCCYSENQRLNGGINLRFDRGFSDTSYFSRTISFNRTSMSISNPNNGDILFYSNGCDIYNKNDQVMDGGLEINPGIPYIQVCKQTTLGYYLAKGGAILEWPDRPTEFAVIHRAYKNSGIGDTVDHLYYSSVDLNKNAGLGRVIKKNVILYQGDMYKRHFDIVKHANGRDWWIITYKVKSDTALTFLLQPDGFKGPFKQSFPIERYEEDFTPNSAISNDGTIIARIDPFIGIFLSSFNRETGIFSTLKKYPYWLDPNSVVISGISFSPNSKYLYINSRNYLYQLTVDTGNQLSNLVLIDTFDLFRDPFSVSFNQPQLALDGRIYYNTTNGAKYLHYVNNPNKLGKDCNFKQRGLRLPAQNTITMPYFPNYRLGPIDGSLSDTLGIDNVPWAWWRYDQDTARYRCFEFVDLSGYLTEESEPEWYWDMSDGTQSRDTSPIHCFEKDGIYEVCLIVKNKYGSDTLCRTLNVGTSLTNDEGKIEITTDIFPNPATDHFVLNVHDYIPESMYLHLINPQGQTVYRERIYQGSNVIDTENLLTGIYLVNIFERGVLIKSERIIVVK